MKRQDLWYKNVIVFCLDVDTYLDGGGVGDFAGLSMRLDQLASLNIFCFSSFAEELA
jgi:maltose alpha-D-glucosyltransferase/alpha-amylase